MQVEGGTAHPGFMCHKQPSMERCLREVIAAQPQSQIRVGSTVHAIEETGEDVVVTYSTNTGEMRSIRAKFLVGADGKTGFTRKKYLEPKGITMEKDEKYTAPPDFYCKVLQADYTHRFKYEEAWVAVNIKVTLPTRQSHPHFPLWDIGYSPEQVFDSFFPPEFRFICNPDRPAVCGHFGLPEDRLWRFEFVVEAGEDGMKMAKQEGLRKVIFPYLTHPRERYK